MFFDVTAIVYFAKLIIKLKKNVGRVSMYCAAPSAYSRLTLTLTLTLCLTSLAENWHPGYTPAARNRGVARNFIWVGINWSRRQNNHKKI